MLRFVEIGADDDVVMNRDGVDDLLKSEFTLGGNASVAAGPVGRSAEASRQQTAEGIARLSWISAHQEPPMRLAPRCAGLLLAMLSAATAICRPPASQRA